MKLRKVGCIALGVSLSLSAFSKDHDKPNIIFYITDDMGWMDTPVYNNLTQAKTPNLEYLARQGMVFNYAFIASPTCAPSRAALFTGLMPARNGVEENHEVLGKEHLLLHEVLKNNGYEVAAFGKVAHGNLNLDFGFDYYSGNRTKLADEVAAYMDQRAGTGPVCLLVGDPRPHVPWTDSLLYDPDDIHIPEFLIDTWDTREHRAMYYSDITGIDTEVGKVYALAQERFGDNFIFIFSSDHGAQWPFAKWNLYDAGIRVPMIVVWPGKVKANTRTNAMVSWIDYFPTLLDVTGSEIPEGLDGRSFSRVLLRNRQTFRDQIFTTHSGDRLFNVYPIRSVRDNRYKFILNLHPEFYHTNHSDLNRLYRAGAYWNSWDEAAKNDEQARQILSRYFMRPAEEFYDIVNDPTEQVNLINDPRLAKTIDKMRQSLYQWMEEQGDQKTVFRPPYYLYEDRPVRPE
jgi:N-sulfoglucosamine sulfohydrolase